MRKHTCHLDLRQRSLYVTITIGPIFPLGFAVDQQPQGKFIRQSRGEVQHTTFSQLTQPIPKPICDRSGQLDNTQDVFVVKGETSRSHEINEKGFHGELCSSDRSGKLDERNSSSAHTVKEQHAGSKS